MSAMRFQPATMFVISTFPERICDGRFLHLHQNRKTTLGYAGHRKQTTNSCGACMTSVSKAIVSTDHSQRRLLWIQTEELLCTCRRATGNRNHGHTQNDRKGSLFCLDSHTSFCINHRYIQTSLPLNDAHGLHLLITNSWHRQRAVDEVLCTGGTGAHPRAPLASREINSSTHWASILSLYHAKLPETLEVDLKEWWISSSNSVCVQRVFFCFYRCVTS